MTIHRKIIISFFFITVIILTGIGCGRAVNRAAERRIRDALPDLLGPARQYRAHVANAPERTLRGRLANVTIDGEDVQLANGLLLDRLHLDLRNVEVNAQRGRVERVGSALFTATISAATLDEYLAGESPPGETLRRTRIRLENGFVTISAQREVLGIGVPFQLTGPLRVAGPQRVEIDPTRLTVVGIAISGLPLRFLKQRFESAVDLSRLPFPLQLTGVQTTPGKLILSGIPDVSAILRTQGGAR